MNIAAAVTINYSIIFYTSCQEKGEFNVNSKNNKMELLGNTVNYTRRERKEY